jgi:cytochrome P450
MLAAEGQIHKRMRRVGTPAFSLQNMRALAPLVFQKAQELKDKWEEMIDSQSLLSKAVDSLEDEEKKMPPRDSTRLDVCHWVSRATFDVIGLAGKCTQIDTR